MQSFRSPYVILFSHGNSTDLGGNFENFFDLAFNLKVKYFHMKFLLIMF